MAMILSVSQCLHWLKFYKFHCMYSEQHMFDNCGGTLRC
uniref:Uncharacterized protein n=1 Tax=Setaria italica TaxID=4555 RepID=K4A3M3_SETIT